MYPRVSKCDSFCSNKFNFLEVLVVKIGDDFCTHRKWANRFLPTLIATPH
jgi:hypothetical protein